MIQNNFCYRYSDDLIHHLFYGFNLVGLSLFFLLLPLDLKADTEEYIPTDFQISEINNESLQKTFIRVEILQRRNQEIQNRIEQLENQNKALIDRLVELSVEFDKRIESLSLEYREFKNQTLQSVENQISSNQGDQIKIDFQTQDIYHQGIVAISLEQYQKSVSLLKQFLEQVDPNANHLILKAKYWIAISLSKLQEYNQSYTIFFELENTLKNLDINQQGTQIVNLDINQIRLEMVNALIAMKQNQQANDLINKFRELNDKELNNLLESVEQNLSNLVEKI